MVMNKGFDEDGNAILMSPEEEIAFLEWQGGLVLDNAKQRDEELYGKPLDNIQALIASLPADSQWYHADVINRIQGFLALGRYETVTYGLATVVPRNAVEFEVFDKIMTQFARLLQSKAS